MCNQLFLQFSMDHFETMHTCCGYIENVHVNFCRQKNNFDKIMAFWTSTIFLVILGNFLHCRVWSLCNQLLLQFSMDHFETIHTCCGYIEDVHVNFCR